MAGATKKSFLKLVLCLCCGNNLLVLKSDPMKKALGE